MLPLATCRYSGRAEYGSSWCVSLSYPSPAIMYTRHASLLIALLFVLPGCTEESLIGSVVYNPDLEVVQTERIDPLTGITGSPRGFPIVHVTVRNRGDGTAYNSHVALRIKRHADCDATNCRLYWLDARGRGSERSCRRSAA